MFTAPLVTLLQEDARHSSVYRSKAHAGVQQYVNAGSYWNHSGHIDGSLSAH